MTALSSRKAIKEYAHRLAKHLKDCCVEARGKDWTKHIFQSLTDFCRSEFGQQKPAVFHNHHPEGQKEFLWDFIALGDDGSILLAAESEQHAHNRGLEAGLKHGFEKLLYVYASLRVLIFKA